MRILRVLLTAFVLLALIGLPSLVMSQRAEFGASSARADPALDNGNGNSNRNDNGDNSGDNEGDNNGDNSDNSNNNRNDNSDNGNSNRNDNQENANRNDNERHRGRGVAPHRLEQQRGAVELELAQLVEHQKAVLFIADDARRCDLDVGAGHRCGTCGGLLEQAAIAMQDQELLGVLGARQRPQPGAAATGHDDGLNRDGGHELDRTQ